MVVNSYDALDGNYLGALKLHRSGQFYINSPVLFAGDKIFAGGDNYYYAFDIQSNTLLWQIQGQGRQFSDVIASDKQLFTLDEPFSHKENTFLSVFDIQSGELIWEQSMLGAVRPVLADNKLVVITIEGWFRLDEKPPIHLNILDSRTGHLLWRLSLEGYPGFSRPAVVGDTIYLTTITKKDSEAKLGIIWAVDIDSGELLWTLQVEAGIETSPVVVDGILYVATSEGELLAIE